MSDRTIPAGGAMVHGHDAEGNPTQTYFAEGIEVPAIGTIRYDDNGQPNGFFGSDGYWHAGAPTPELTTGDVTIVPINSPAV